jgi:hypothetical protein
MTLTPIEANRIAEASPAMPEPITAEFNDLDDFNVLAISD